MKLQRSLAVFLSLSSAAFSAEPDWPQFRGPELNPVARNRALLDEWSRTTNVEWVTNVPGRGWSSPIVTGGKVFLTAAVTEGRSKPPQIGTAYSTEFALPDVESRQGFDILEEHFADSAAGGEGGTVVFRAEQGVTDPEVQAAMTAFFEEASQIEGITLVSPYTPEGTQQISSFGPEAGKIAYAQIGISRDTTLEEAGVIRDQLKELMPQIDGLQIELGGQIFSEFEVPSSELLGIAFAIIVLILAFGSVLAMGLPIGIALAGIGVGTSLAGLLSNFLSIPDFSSTVAIMLGLGVGIDYALFIVTRYRENMHAGASHEEATVVAMDTAGRAVAFAASTVVISLLGMLLMNLSFITGIAVVCAVSIRHSTKTAQLMRPATRAMTSAPSAPMPAASSEVNIPV